MDKYNITEYSHQIEDVLFSIIIEPKILFRSGDYSQLQKDAHNHSYYEIFLIKEGEIFIYTNNYRYHLKKENLLIINPGSEHYTFNENENSEWFCFGINFVKKSRGTSKNNIYQKFITAFNNEIVLQIENCSLLRNRLELFEHYVNNDMPGKNIRIKASIVEIAFLMYDLTINVISKNYKNNLPVEPNVNILYCFKIDTFFYDNYKNDISLELLAKHLYLSPEQTNRIIKKIYNQTFHQKLINMRINAAQKYIRETDLPINKIAYMVGYSSLNSFYTAFKKISNYTPKEYRKNHV